MSVENKIKIPSISFFIPIRKNSKRIINKNIKPLPGLKFGLTELKIKQLGKFRFLFSKYFKTNLEIVISSDCPKVLKFANHFKWIKIFKRNKSLATDDSLDKLIKYVPSVCKNDYILWTHVTSPLFNEMDYIEFIRFFFKNKTKKNYSRSAFSADAIQKFLINDKGNWISHNYKKKKWPRTQDLSPLYIVNSAAFIAKRSVYIKEKDRICKKPMAIVSRINSGFDIDNIEEFKALKNESLVRKYNKN